MLGWIAPRALPRSPDRRAISAACMARPIACTPATPASRTPAPAAVQRHPLRLLRSPPPPRGIERGGTPTRTRLVLHSASGTAAVVTAAMAHDEVSLWAVAACCGAPTKRAPHRPQAVLFRAPLIVSMLPQEAGGAVRQLLLTCGVMFVGALACGMLPLLAAPGRGRRQLRMVNAAGAGLLLSSALAVILPEGFAAFHEAMVRGGRCQAGCGCRPWPVSPPPPPGSPVPLPTSPLRPCLTCGLHARRSTPRTASSPCRNGPAGRCWWAASGP